ncbi:hypothetical protein [Paraburkholderia sp. Ac-20347]|uniref:hypothetical protein n=1 Tax=Paraburkholderia sp. Ac-20347 TaxID=2703892 RepID=UPI0019813B32|nr:hypothetical protein [Paraburkholderia sp. Ac-20347]MBN3813421.1 hypothetical protein [Paraburkholderia sp. Ac-20347]
MSLRYGKSKGFQIPHGMAVIARYIFCETKKAAEQVCGKTGGAPQGLFLGAIRDYPYLPFPALSVPNGPKTVGHLRCWFHAKKQGADFNEQGNVIGLEQAAVAGEEIREIRVQPIHIGRLPLFVHPLEN